MWSVFHPITSIVLFHDNNNDYQSQLFLSMAIRLEARI